MELQDPRSHTLLLLSPLALLLLEPREEPGAASKNHMRLLPARCPPMARGCPSWQGSLESELVGLTLNMPEGLRGAESQSKSSMHSIAWFVDMGRRKAYFIESKIQLIEDVPQYYAPLRKTNSVNLYHTTSCKVHSTSRDIKGPLKIDMLW